MKAKILAISVLWAALLIASSLVLRGTPHSWTMLLLITVSAATSIAVLAAPDCPRKAPSPANSTDGHDCSR